MEAENKIVTELDAIENLKKIFYNRFKTNIALLNTKNADLVKNQSALDPLVVEQKKLEIETIKINAQVAMYSYNAIYKCKTFYDLMESRRWLSISATNFGKSFNENAASYNNSIKNLTTAEINEMSTKLYFDKGKFYLLKDAISLITETLKLKVTKINAPNVEIISSQEAELSSEIQKSIGILNSQLYAAKLALKKIDPNNEAQFQIGAKKVFALEKQREDAVSSLIGSVDDAHFMLGDVRRIEDSALNTLGVVRKAPYTLHLETFKDRLDELNIALADLKFNKGKSKTFHILHQNDKKFDSVTLSRDIIKLSDERRDILISVLGENSPVLKVLNDLISGEGLYNIDGGYQAFRRQSGDIGDTGRSRALYVRGRDSVLEAQMIIEDALRTEFEKKRRIEIISTSPTYETEKERRDLAYQKLISDISRYRKGKAIRDAREAEKEKERLAKTARIKVQMAEAHAREIKSDLGLPAIDISEERLM